MTSNLKTVSDAAKVLGVTERTVWRMIDEKRLESVKLGQRTMVALTNCQCTCQSLPLYKRLVRLANELQQLAEELERR